MSAVAPLVGTTPRTVKRFVNIYRLLKTRAVDPAAFDKLRDGLGDHEVVAFLLAVVTGHPSAAGAVLAALTYCAPRAKLADVVKAAVSEEGPNAETAEKLCDWLRSHPRYATAEATRFASWAAEVGRFSFTPPASK